MNLRALTLATSTAMLTLAGCANQQTGTDPMEASNQRLSSIEAKLQAGAGATEGLIGALGKQVDALSGELRRLQDAAASQASSASAQQAVASALATRMDKSEQRLGEIAKATQTATTQAADTQAALRGQLNGIEQRLERLDAQNGYQTMNTVLEHQADTEILANSLEAAEDQLEEMAAQIGEILAQSSDLQTSLNEKTDSAHQRLEKSEQRLDELAAQSYDLGQRLERLGAQNSYQSVNTALEHQADTEILANNLEAAEGQLAEMADQIGEILAQNNDLQTALAEKAHSASQRIEKAEQRLDEMAAQTRLAIDQTASVQAAFPALREKVAEVGPRLGDYDARLAALNLRLDEVARMAQEAFDATGLGQRKIFGKVIESITLVEDKTLFPINSPALGEQDKAKLDALVGRLKTLGTNYHLQIQGHTEGFGSDDYNYELGKARAEAVKNYLNEKGGIPGLRMSVMSYGSIESAGHVTKSNRRIVIQVLQ